MATRESMPGLTENLRATSLAVDQHHLDLVVVTLGEEDAAVDGEVGTDFLGLERERINLLIGLLVGLVLRNIDAAGRPVASALARNSRGLARNSGAGTASPRAMSHGVQLAPI